MAMNLQEVTVESGGWMLLAADVARCHLLPRTGAGLVVHVGTLPAPPDPAPVIELAGEALRLDDLLPGERVFARAIDAPVRLSVLTSAPGSLRIAGHDAQDDMLKVKSVQKKMRDSFTRPLEDLWEVTATGGASATVAAGVLTIASGTTAGAVVELLSRETFTVPFRAMAGLTCTRHASNHFLIEAVSVDPATGLPDGRNAMGADIGGAASTTATQMRWYTQNGGLAPLESAAVTILTTASYSILEFEPFSDEASIHSRAIDSTAGRANSYVRHQQIPDPNALYKLRIRSLNHGAWKPITGAAPGAGGAIQLTVAAHGYTAGATIWVEAMQGILDGAGELRGNYVIAVPNANTIELVGTSFTGAYVPGSGRVALAAAPTAVTLQMQFVNCQDYAELTAEVTAGRGQIVEGQAIAARTVTGSVVTATVAGSVAHDAARGNTAPIVAAARALSAAYATVASNDVADLVATLQGVLVTRPWQIPELEWSHAGAAGGITGTADVVLAAAAGAGLRRYLTSLQLKNAGTVATEVVVRDGASVIWRGHLGAAMGATDTHVFADPLRSSPNAALTIACLTAGAQVHADAQGFTAA
jgi:hypothetical protein